MAKALHTVATGVSTADHTCGVPVPGSRRRAHPIPWARDYDLPLADVIERACTRRCTTTYAIGHLDGAVCIQKTARTHDGGLLICQTPTTEQALTVWDWWWDLLAGRRR